MPRCQEIKSFGNHADNSGHHGSDSIPDRIGSQEKLLEEQDKTDGNNRSPTICTSFTGSGSFRTVAFFGSFGFQGQFGNVRISAYLVQAGGTFAGYDKTSGKERIADYLVISSDSPVIRDSLT